MNYSLQEYANDIIYTLAEACREHELPMPHIISESGRALTAHHALLLLKVIDVESQVAVVTADARARTITRAARAGATELRDASRRRRVREVYHDATFDKERAQELFNSGVLVAARPRDRRADLPRDR